MSVIITRKDIRWTPRLIRRLRGRRTQAEFGTLVGATTNTVWRWEDGRVEPDAEHTRRLSELATCERFLDDWKLVGSGVLVRDLGAASERLSVEHRQTLDRRARSLRD
jgi:transcriptional regulator with XRE-family HTH domain